MEITNSLSTAIIRKMSGDYLDVILVKKFVQAQIDRINKRIEELSQFDGLGEVMLQKAELAVVRDNLIKDAGEKLI